MKHNLKTWPVYYSAAVLGDIADDIIQFEEDWD